MNLKSLFWALGALLCLNGLVHAGVEIESNQGSSSVGVSTGFGGYYVEPATKTFQLNKGVKLSTAAITSLAPGVLHVVANSSDVYTAKVSLSTEVVGSLPLANLAAGTLPSNVIASSIGVAGVQVPQGLNASGTPGAGNFLRGDGSWATPASAAGDGFGSHTATQPINAAGFAVLNASAIAVSGNSGLITAAGSSLTFRISGVNYVFDSSGNVVVNGALIAVATRTWSVCITSGTGWNGLNLPGVFRAPNEHGVTIVKVLAETLGAATTVQYQLVAHPFGSANSAGTNLFSTQQSTANNTGVTTTSFGSATLTKNTGLSLATPASNAAQGSPVATSMTFTIYYIENKE